jgi:hypothetical protein
MTSPLVESSDSVEESIELHDYLSLVGAATEVVKERTQG